MPSPDDENPDIQSEENLDDVTETEDEALPEDEVSETDKNSASEDTVTAEDVVAEAAADSTTVENIEHIEKVEINGNGFGSFMTYFPHIVISTISIVALVGMIFIMAKQGETTPSETARSLITYLVAVFTIVIALTLTLMAFFSNLKDFKERFAMGKEVLTILIGVLGTIIGFYFGAAAPEKELPKPPVASDIQKQTAEIKEREGFEKLIAGDYESAISAFQESENAWNSYHNTYDIARLLRKNKTQMDDPEKKKEVLGIIVSQYSYGAPKDLLDQLRAIASQ